MFTIFGFSETELFDYINIMSVLMFLAGNFYRIKDKQLCYGFQQLAENHSITQQKMKLLLGLEILLLAVFQGASIGILNTQFGKLVGTGANYFGLMSCSPILLIIVSLILRSNPLKQLDFVTPAYPLALFITKIACFCCGCCTGIPWSYGYQNYFGKLVEFPVQLVESMVAFLLFLFMRWYQKRGKDGTCFPVYLITYSFIRFFTEFLRCEKNVFGFLKTYQILCLAGVAVGLIYLILVTHFRDHINRWFDSKFPSLIVFQAETERHKENGIAKYFISYFIILFMLMAIFGKFLVSHIVIFIPCVFISLLIFTLFLKILYTNIAPPKLCVIALWLMLSVTFISFALPLNDSWHFHHGSVYGFILAVPILIYPLIYLHIPYNSLLSISVLCECLLITVRKASCLAAECCLGKYLATLDLHFPGQTAELFSILIIFVVSVMVIRRRGAVSYAWFMFSYGITQSLLNIFRYENNPSIWNVSNGEFWPLILILVSLIRYLWEICRKRYGKVRPTCN